ncbi:aldose 1-epimerase family protein [Gramella sp. BOM4]|nr:aldose 1-epimerase family protein [Christiangramia bathymodioli]
MVTLSTKSSVLKKHSAENEYLKIEVQETGAELCSLVNKSSGIEHIWQANPDVWASHAPNLFPVIGVLKNGTYYFEGKEYSVPKHGFIRYNNHISLKEKSENRLVFELGYSQESLEIYPFKFCFRIAFTLNGKDLEISHQIINRDTKPIYYSVGGHPAFNIQLFKDEEIEDYFLEFDQRLDLETYLLNDEGLVSTKTKKVLENDHQIQLTRHIFDNDALIFKNIRSKKVNLVSAKNGKILSMEFKDFKNFGIWAKPGASYVCLEPWLGIADIEGTNQNLPDKEGIEVLEAGKKIEQTYHIKIE